MSVYAIQPSCGGPIKLGHVGSRRGCEFEAVLKRRKELQTGCPIPLRIVSIWWKGVEAQVHSDLSDHRLHGEWFDANDAVLNYVNSKFDEFPYGKVAASKHCDLVASLCVGGMQDDFGLLLAPNRHNTRIQDFYREAMQ